MALQKIVYNCETGEETRVDMTPEEEAALAAQQQAFEAALAAQQQVANAAQAQRAADTQTLHDTLVALGNPDAAAALLRILGVPAPA